jgi:hypothetical protein
VRRPVVAPVEPGGGHDRPGDVGRAVAAVGRPVGVTEAVAEDRLVPDQVADDGLRVRVEQQLAGVAAQPALGVVRPVDAVAVALAGLDARVVAVPDVAGDLGQLDPGLAAALVEQAQLDLVRDLREDREVGAVAVVGGAERVRLAGPQGGVVIVRFLRRAARPSVRRPRGAGCRRVDVGGCRRAGAVPAAVGRVQRNRPLQPVGVGPDLDGGGRGVDDRQVGGVAVAAGSNRVWRPGSCVATTSGPSGRSAAGGRGAGR